jgi:hypothetical protein
MSVDAKKVFAVGATKNAAISKDCGVFSKNEMLN